MKRLKYISAFALLALMGLWSCSSDLQTANSSASHGKGHKVSLTIGSNAKTRTAAPTNLGGFDREKAIDGNKLYAVVFDQQGKFFETIQITDYNSGDGTCSFTLSDAGVYYGYIIANTSKGTALTGLTAGTSTEDDLFNIIEDTDPGTNLAASTNFLMTSKRTLLDVDGDADTALGTVTLTRAVARIDIDVTAVDGLAITEVKVENRYKKSLIIRGNNPDDTSLGTATPTDTKTYTRGTSAGQVNALSDGTGLVNDQQWQGVIYGYENINTNTVVTITHTLNGVASQTIVDFADANSGTGQAIKRNNIYTVKLTNEVLSPTLSNIVSTITVVDWDNSVNLAYTDLTDHEKPDYKVTSNHSAFDYTDNVNMLNPGRVIAKKSDALTEITLQITSHGKVASEVSFVDKNGAAFDFLGDAVGGTIEQDGATTYGSDGSIIQNYVITIPQAIVTDLELTDYFTFKVHNVFDDTAIGSRVFRVYPIDYRLNPLYYVAESYVKDYNTTTKIATFEPDPKVLPSKMYCISSAMQKFSATHSVSHYDGYRSCDVIDGTTDFTYHLGTLTEWRSIIPCPTVDAATTSDILNASYSSGLKTEPQCVFGYNNDTKTGITGKSYWSSYTANSNKRYAIRFLDTDYCSVWKYEYKNNMGIISAKLIDKISSTDNSALTAMMTTITSAPDSYWEEDQNSGTFQRFFYASGRRDGNSDGPPNSYNSEKYTWILMTTMDPNGGGNILDVVIGPGHNRTTGSTVECTIEPSNYASWGFNISLFRELP